MKTKLPALIGVIPLTPLAGSPGAKDLHPSDSLRIAGLRAANEAKVLAKAGFEGLILENRGDSPHLNGRAPPETVASFAIIAAAVRESVSLPIGIHLLEGDAGASLAIAAVANCDFMIVDGFAKCAAALLRERARLGCEVKVLANVIQGELLPDEADGIIFDGTRILEKVGKGSNAQTWLREGLVLENLGEVRKSGHGIMIGSALRKRGLCRGELDLRIVRLWVSRFRAIQKKSETGRRRK